MIAFSLAGPPRGKDRPRFRIMGKGAKKFVQVYTTKETEAAENAVRAAWMDAGGEMIEGPVSVDVVAYVARPDSHFKKDGTLSAEGLRNPVPMRQKPDLDNVVKLVLDALNKQAFEDDVRVVRLYSGRFWAPFDEQRTSVKVSAYRRRIIA